MAKAGIWPSSRTVRLTVPTRGPGEASRSARAHRRPRRLRSTRSGGGKARTDGVGHGSAELEEADDPGSLAAVGLEQLEHPGVVPPRSPASA